MHSRATMGSRDRHARPPLGFGVHLACDAMQWPECREVAIAAEELGYASLWFPDHYVATPDGADPDPHRPVLDGWTTMGAITQATRRIRLGPMVASNTFRHPAILAKMATTLDHLSGGRLELGLGIGWFDREHTSLGIPFPETPERLAAMAEALRIVRALWTEPAVTFTGRHYTLDDAIAEPKPVQKPGPPVVVASSGEKVGLRLVAELGDHWNTYRPADEFARLARVLDGHCAALDRDPATVTRSLMIPLYLEPDEAARRKIATWGDGWFLTGRDHEIAAQIARFVAAGTELVVLQVDRRQGNADTLRAFAERFF